MKETESLIQRAGKYLKSAEILLQAGDYESSVSRTCYAMFYCAEAALLVSYGLKRPERRFCLIVLDFRALD